MKRAASKMNEQVRGFRQSKSLLISAELTVLSANSVLNVLNYVIILSRLEIGRASQSLSYSTSYSSAGSLIKIQNLSI